MSVQSKSVSSKGKILVADDQPQNRELLEEILAKRGFQVTCVEDGVQVLERMQQATFDVVILDVLMPRMGGFEVCRRIKANPETYLTRVVLVTALSRKEDRLEGLQASADDFLTRPVDSAELIARVQSLVKLKQRTDELERAESVLFALARSIEGKDPYTAGHCERLSNYSAALAERLGLPADEITALRRGGVVHDIGKVAVPDAVLLKPAKLTPEERLLMQEHPVVGERICAPLKSFRLVLPIIRHHHEKYDGSGYPDRLQGENIPMTARILQIVDVYDALTTDRPYKAAYSIKDALATMKEEVERGWWDPRIFREFEKFVKGGGTKLRARKAAAGGS